MEISTTDTVTFVLTATSKFQVPSFTAAAALPPLQAAALQLRRGSSAVDLSCSCPVLAHLPYLAWKLLSGARPNSLGLAGAVACCSRVAVTVHSE
jgi:hypothetical protein